MLSTLKLIEAIKDYRGELAGLKQINILCYKLYYSRDLFVFRAFNRSNLNKQSITKIIMKPDTVKLHLGEIYVMYDI